MFFLDYRLLFLALSSALDLQHFLHFADNSCSLAMFSLYLSVDLFIVVFKADAAVDQRKYFTEQGDLLTVAIENYFVMCYLGYQ